MYQNSSLLCVYNLVAIPGGFLCIIIPGVGEDAAPADSQGLAVVSISIGATSEGSEWSLIVSQAVIIKSVKIFLHIS